MTRGPYWINSGIAGRRLPYRGICDDIGGTTIYAGDKQHPKAVCLMTWTGPKAKKRVLADAKIIIEALTKAWRRKV